MTLGEFATASKAEILSELADETGITPRQSSALRKDDLNRLLDVLDGESVPGGTVYLSTAPRKAELYLRLAEAVGFDYEGPRPLPEVFPRLSSNGEACRTLRVPVRDRTEKHRTKRERIRTASRRGPLSGVSSSLLFLRDGHSSEDSSGLSYSRGCLS